MRSSRWGARSVSRHFSWICCTVSQCCPPSGKLIANEMPMKGLGANNRMKLMPSAQVCHTQLTRSAQVHHTQLTLSA
eukprot:973992-Pelagomonas_calceolata.AAC.3